MRAAMAMEMIVGPARAPADRWTPERFAENTPDNAAGNSPDRARDDEACPRSRRGTYPIGACARRSDRDSAQRTRRQHTRRQNEIAHLPSPWPRQAGCRAKPAQQDQPQREIPYIRGKRQAVLRPPARRIFPPLRSGARQIIRFSSPVWTDMVSHQPAITRRSISPMLLIPVSAMLTLSSLRMISIARATPACPPAPSP